MSTKFTDPYVQKMKKKNPKTGSTTNLKGYTVGSRAPPMAVSSGTRISSSYKLEANVVKSDGGLRGKGANTQNVPTAAVIVLRPSSSSRSRRSRASSKRAPIT